MKNQEKDNKEKDFDNSRENEEFYYYPVSEERAGRAEKILTHASFLAGAGGLDIGFARAGFSTIWAIEHGNDACETYKRWSLKMKNLHLVQDDLRHVDVNGIPYADIYTAIFSGQDGLAIKYIDHGNRPGILGISDNDILSFSYFFYLNNFSSNQHSYTNRVAYGLLRYKRFAEVVDKNKPEAFMMIFKVSKNMHTAFSPFFPTMDFTGYSITEHLVNALDYDVPQNRKYYIVTGLRNGYNSAFQMPSPIGLDPKNHIDKMLRDPRLSNPSPNEYWATPANLQRYHYSLMHDVSDSPIPSIVSRMPLHLNGARCISYKEAAAIQTFPFNMYFHGSLNSKYTQIGEAVPVNLAEAIAREFKQIL